jgi:beta-lactamase class C ACT/MIR
MHATVHRSIARRSDATGLQRSAEAQKNRAMNRTKIFAILIGPLLSAIPVRGHANVEAIVAENIRPILPQNGSGGGVAVAIRINGETRSFNYGFANDARNERVTADSIFNLGSVGKLFATTTLAEAVKRGEVSLDDPVAKYVTELQRGGDIRHQQEVQSK